MTFLSVALHEVQLLDEPPEQVKQTGLQVGH